jgi:amino acid adenylation domain-containing protein
MDKRGNIEDIYPLSPMQQGILFHCLYSPDSGMYIEQLVLPLQSRDELDVAAFEQAWRSVVDRHSILRTAIVWEGREKPLQVVLRQVKVRVNLQDWRDCIATEQEKRLDEWIHADREKGFELSKAPLMRLALIRLSEHTWRLVGSFHHIVKDGWSGTLMIKEVFAFYQAFCREQELHLAQPRPFRDYIVWLQQQDLAKAEAFWRQKLQGFTAPTPLAIARLASGLLGEEDYGERQVRLSAATTARLGLLARQYHLTMSTWLYGAWALLLNRYSGEQDVVFGTTVSGRPAELEGVEDMLGLFINTLPMRVHISPGTSVLNWLNLLQTLQLEIRQYEYSSLAQVQGWSQVPRGLPLFESIVIFENIPENVSLEGLDVGVSVGTGRAIERTNYPLTLVAFPGAELVLKAHYDGRRFAGTDIARMLGHWQMLLEGMIENPEQCLVDVPLLTEVERRQLLVEWNSTRREFPATDCFHQLFEEQARKTPDRVALREVCDLSPIYDGLESDAISPQVLADLERCCFTKNPYIYEYPPSIVGRVMDLKEADLQAVSLLRTQRHDLVALAHPLKSLLEYLDGQSNLGTLFGRMKNDQNEYVIYIFQVDAIVEFPIPYERKTFAIQGRFEDLVLLIQTLYKLNLIELAGLSPEIQTGSPIEWRPKPEQDPEPDLESALAVTREASLSPVLLLGDTAGSATMGILYLASYLRRKGIEVYCQLNDVHYVDAAAMEQNIQQLLDKFKPKLVGVSLKWFPHIARGLEICRLVKKHAPQTKIVLGGDSATFFCEELIRKDYVDYVIRGDGELPLLKLVMGEPEIPNCVYKRNGEIVRTAYTFTHTEENSSEIYLSHLEDILVSPDNLSYAPYVFVFTGQGCAMHCFYCAGACENQQRIFNRPSPYLRPVPQVRNDILQVKPYTCTLMFDFDLPGYNLENYYERLWEGIDLKSHFAHIYFWSLPSQEFIELAARTFKYVYLNIDLCSLSERHRLHLASLKAVKPQPSDDQVLAVFEVCERLGNVQVIINLISGLPFFTEQDIESSKTMLSRIMNGYTCFGGLDWGRLHAQPGAPITLDYEKFDMAPSATTFEDYFKVSLSNLSKNDRYPDLALLNYPLIYYKDDRLNSLVSKHYAELTDRVNQYLRKRRRKVRFHHKELLYRELNEQTNQLANYLSKLGVGPEVRVGIYMERSLEMIVGVLGVLKAGGAYVPLDLAYPPERLAFIIQETRPLVLLTQTQLKTKLPELHGTRVVYLDAEWDAIVQESTQPLASQVTTENLAYVMYTSGSTGQPKGVLITHQGLGNLAQAQIQAFGVSSDSCVLQFASLGFDVSVTEVLMALLSGATLVLAKQESLLPGSTLLRLLRDQSITTVTLTPSVLAMLPFDNLSQLQTIVSVGEPCPAELVERWGKGHNFCNAYGPTETVCATLAPGLEEGGAPTVGRPMDNTQVYLLDPWLRTVPVGVPGELYIGGVGLARGYINRPDLTAERFIPNPFALSSASEGEASSGQGVRLYKTGDLARYYPDGKIELLGRLDHQVKIRGFRVELGEIEAMLREYPGVQESVVLTRQDAPGGRLAAYVVSNLMPAPTSAELRSFLKARLPEYMVPATFTFLQSLPLMVNGKVDRQALPAPDAARSELETSFVAPRTPVEQVVAGIWAQVLNVECVGVHDNFFELGGHSLLATQVISQLYQAFREDLPLHSLFESPTVAGVAEALVWHETSPGCVAAIAELRVRMAGMSPDEVRAALQDKKRVGGR